MATDKKAIVLLSGGLDSTVALAWAVREYEVKRAIFVGYNHRAFKMEATVVTGIAWHYRVEVSDIRLPFYGEICKTYTELQKTAADTANTPDGAGKLQGIWIPNRNLLFVSIAAAFAEGLGCDTIIAGLNAEEAELFPDNSEEFVERTNRALEVSTLSKVRLVAPLIKLRKSEILKLGAELKVPFDLVYSCYEGEEKMCGVCMSCRNLKNAMAELSETDSVPPDVLAKIARRFSN
ncbi:MAG: 7-cyano-7-deazaguanine synthase QueC [Candidatus Coatesbacteria bacterium]|nr:7-cyano-7-deazaguanine synthase QueC [Candidatus Coatesbacteria bacterium]